MKRSCYIVIAILLSISSHAQLVNGSTAPDFTFTDIDGNTQNLYTYLNAGKYVAMDVSATWCVPCFAYHNSGVSDSLYTIHDIPGDQTWKILFVEGDGGTDLADLQGTGTNTVGDWITGTLYPIMNPPYSVALNDFKTGYNISFYPTLFLICPNKKVYQDTLNASNKPHVNTWEYVANTMCGPAGLDNINDVNPLTIYPNPSHDNVILYFSLNSATTVKLSVTNILGQTVDTKIFGYLYPGDQALKYDVSYLKAGIYFFTVSDGNSRYVRKKVIVQ